MSINNKSTDKQLNKVKQVYSFWGRFPLFYMWQDYITFIGRPSFIRGLAIKQLNLRPGSKVLEVACGSGRNFSFIMEVIGRDGVLVGFDYSQEMLDAAQKLCQKKNWDNTKLIRGDAAELKAVKH
ncbi:MAG: methyltransferase domain-containing protein [Candidatus Magasanikbacteria bacterium]|nr:methyltransferase domain-containing protein [Candidatus Magasanikbacteria bacterium]